MEGEPVVFRGWRGWFRCTVSTKIHEVSDETRLEHVIQCMADMAVGGNFDVAFLFQPLITPDGVSMPRSTASLLCSKPKFQSEDLHT